MEVRAKALFAVAGLAVLAAAQVGDFYMKDKSGQSSITGWTSFQVKTLPEGRHQYTVIGNPFQARWEGQKLTFTAKRGEFLSLGVSQSTTIVEKATLTGGVHAVATRPSRKGGTAEQTITIDSPTVEYTAENETLTCPGKVAVDQQDKAASQSFRVDGSSGKVGLHPSGTPQRDKQAIQTLRLEGPVTFELHSLAEVKDSADPKKSTLKPFVIKGSGRLLTYDDATRTMVLDRDVKVEGTHPAMVGTMSAVRAVFTLDENWNPVEIELTGDPGHTTATPPPLRVSGRRKA